MDNMPGQIKANLIQLSYNMWCDHNHPYYKQEVIKRLKRLKEKEKLRKINKGIIEVVPDVVYQPFLRFDEGLGREIIERMAKAGMNMVVFELGDGVKYKSHPEIAVEGAWSVKKLKQELDFCWDRGIEPIPSLNFSTAHDIWLGEYSRKVSTREYYKVCSNLIEEVVDIFNGPRFFHLGMDEETASNQRFQLYAVIRQGSLWWEDLNFLVRKVEENNVQAWVWSDVLWHKGKGEFAENMPRSVIQSNWYYHKEFEEDGLSNSAKIPVKSFVDLDELGYKQIPAGGTYVCKENYPLLVEYCRRHICPANLLGFMMTTWKPVLRKYKRIQLEALEIVKNTHTGKESNSKYGVNG